MDENHVTHYLKEILGMLAFLPHVARHVPQMLKAQQILAPSRSLPRVTAQL